MSVHRLKELLGQFSAHVRSGEAPARAGELDHLAETLDKRPLEAARAVLALYEGDAPIDSPQISNGGATLAEETYREALSVWHGLKSPSKLALGSWSDRPRKVVDYAGGRQVWSKGSGYLARYDADAEGHQWRDDAISLKEAEQAALGPPHFAHMVSALQTRLKSLGVDPTTGSAAPLPDPV